MTWIHHTLFFYQRRNTWVVFTFYFLWTVLWTLEVIFCVDLCFQFSWVYMQEWYSESCGSYMFNRWRNGQIFQRGCTILYSHQQSLRVLISPHPPPQLLFSLILAIPVAVKWYLILIYIFLMTNGVEPFVYVLWRNASLYPLLIF